MAKSQSPPVAKESGSREAERLDLKKLLANWKQV